MNKLVKVKKNKIRVAIVGVGNCAKSLIEGVAQYKHTKNTAGLMYERIGGYKAGAIEFVLAYDCDQRKTHLPLQDAMYQRPNCAKDLIPYESPLLETVIAPDTIVKHGAVLDGFADHMLKGDKDERFERMPGRPDQTVEQIAADLIDCAVDVCLLYLPVGSQKATEHYVKACLKAQVPFVNCIPVFIVSNPEWARKIKAAGIPAIGDDMRSQLGASVLSQALQELFFDRGMTVDFHCQTNHGGNTDFRNMLDQSRLASKKISKENVIRSQNDIRGYPVPKNGIHAGPSSYVPFYGDNKIAQFRIEATGFGGAKVEFDAKLSVQDSPNSAGVVIDAIRFLRVAYEMNLVGPLYGPSAATQKTPPMQMYFSDAKNECDMMAQRMKTDLVRMYNLAIFDEDNDQTVVTDTSDNSLSAFSK